MFAAAQPLAQKAPHPLTARFDPKHCGLKKAARGIRITGRDILMNCGLKIGENQTKRSARSKNAITFLERGAKVFQCKMFKHMGTIE